MAFILTSTDLCSLVQRRLNVHKNKPPQLVVLACVIYKKKLELNAAAETFKYFAAGAG